MADRDVKFTGKIDRRSPADEGKIEDPILRENWLARDGVLKKPPGNEAVITDLPDKPRWIARYSTVESSVVSPKTFVYSEDGVISVLDDQLGTSSPVKTLLNTNAYPRSWIFKTGFQNVMYFVDGEFMYTHDGNNENQFEKVDFTDADGDSVEPIDIIEHKDRNFVLSKTKMFVSKNLAFSTFNDANDSLEIIIGSGKGINLAFGKLEDRLFIFTTEGIYVVEGDVISALAATFEVGLVEERNIIAGRSIAKVEKALVFMADDFEIWSWDGIQSQMLTYQLKLKDFVNTYRDKLDKCVAIYEDNYYKFSFVQKGDSEPNTELWWDAFEDNSEIVQGRHVSCYMQTDSTIEAEYVEMGLSNANTIVRDKRGFNYNGTAIATRLRTRDLTLKKGHNVRFTAFYPQFQPTGNRNLIINYLLDGRKSNPDGAAAYWSQNLRGETKGLGFIEITNQNQFSGRVRPKINYARGESIAFEIIDSTLDMRADFQGMGIDFTVKEKSKGSTIGA